MNLMFATPLAAHISAALILALVIVLTTIRFEVIKAKVAMLVESHVQADIRTAEAIASLVLLRGAYSSPHHSATHMEIGRIIGLLDPPTKERLNP